MTTAILLTMFLALSAEPQEAIKLSGAAACPSISPGLVVPKGVPPAAKFYERRIIRHLHEAWGLGHAPVVFAQIHQESGFDCTEVSKAGAAGLAQFMPGTAVLMHQNSAYAKQLKEFCASAGGCPFDPDWAFRAMALLNREAYNRYKQASGDERYGFMLADYNGGTVLRAEVRFCAAHPPCDMTKYFGNVRDNCGRGLPPPPGSSSPFAITRRSGNCEENTNYPQIILQQHRPKYVKWLPPGL
jgi:hypothetical protein